MAAPNGYQTGPDFMFAFVQSYLFQGNTYCFARRNRRNEIQEMHVLNPYRVKPLIAQDGSIFYECGEDFLAGLAPNTIVPERDMIHHRLLVTRQPPAAVGMSGAPHRYDRPSRST